MKEKNHHPGNRSHELCLLLALLLATAWLFTPRILQASDKEKGTAFPDVIWEVAPYTDDEGNEVADYYLTTTVKGYAQAPDGTVSYTYLQAYFDHDYLTFSLYYDDGEIAVPEPSKKDFTLPIRIYFSTLDLSGDTKIIMPVGSQEFHLDEETLLPGTGLSYGDLLIMDMVTGGRFQFTIPVYGWDGYAGTTNLFFVFPHENSNFADLYMEGVAQDWVFPQEPDEKEEPDKDTQPDEPVSGKYIWLKM